MQDETDGFLRLAQDDWDWYEASIAGLLKTIPTQPDGKRRGFMASDGIDISPCERAWPAETSRQALAQTRFSGKLPMLFSIPSGNVSNLG
jgi:hypothetical protein